MLPFNWFLLTRGDAPRAARRLPLAIIFRAFGAVQTEFRLGGKVWMNTNGATLYPPVEGSFSDTVGLFRGHDQHDGIPVLVEFRWDKTNPETPTWQQSFSADNGNSWEANWYMNFSRVGA